MFLFKMMHGWYSTNPIIWPVSEWDLCAPPEHHFLKILSALEHSLFVLVLKNVM